MTSGGSGTSEPQSQIAYGGRIGWYEWLLYPLLALLPAVALIWSLPTWLNAILVVLGALLVLGLLVAGTYGAFDAHAWGGGSLVQIPLMLGSAVLGTTATFALGFTMVDQATPGSFSEPLDGLSAFLYSASVWATGDGAGISSTGGFGRVLTVIETYIGLVMFLVILSTAVAKAFELRPERKRHEIVVLPHAGSVPPNPMSTDHSPDERRAGKEPNTAIKG